MGTQLTPMGHTNPTMPAPIEDQNCEHAAVVKPHSCGHCEQLTHTSTVWTLTAREILPRRCTPAAEPHQQSPHTNQYQTFCTKGHYVLIIVCRRGTFQRPAWDNNLPFTNQEWIWDELLNKGVREIHSHLCRCGHHRPCSSPLSKHSQMCLSGNQLPAMPIESDMQNEAT